MENIVNKILYSKGDKTVPDYTKEIERRRTFAIISHPDAGKTTLTEKFLLYGGAINLAGSVKGKATAYFRYLFRSAVQLRRLLHQHSGYPGTPGLLGGYVPYPDGSRFRRYGDRCLKGCRGTDQKAV